MPTAGLVVAMYPRCAMRTLFGRDVRDVGEDKLLLLARANLEFQRLFFAGPYDAHLNGLVRDHASEVAIELIR